MFAVITPLIGTIARLPRIVQAAGAVYVSGAVVSATKSIIKRDPAKIVAKRALKSWFGLSRSTPVPKKKKHAVKRAANRLVRHPSKENLKAALQTAKAAGIDIPETVTNAVKKL